MKSLDALVEIDLMDHELSRRSIDGRIQLKRKRSDMIPFVHERQETTTYDRVIRCLGFKFDNSIWHP